MICDTIIAQQEKILHCAIGELRLLIPSDWQNKINGTETNVTDPSTNDSYFKSTYSDYYWYKK